MSPIATHRHGDVLLLASNNPPGPVASTIDPRDLARAGPLFTEAQPLRP